MSRIDLQSVDAAGATIYCEFVKNITVSVDDETYHRARVKAASSGLSVSRVVRSFLASFARDETEFDRLKREEEALRERIDDFAAADRLSRDAVHARH
jgi:antitoxin component of RelBE/YafQ-DinJ toxin-antitoxin module